MTNISAEYAMKQIRRIIDDKYDFTLGRVRDIVNEYERS